MAQLGALLAAAKNSPDPAHGPVPLAYACAVSDSLVEYALGFAPRPAVRSDMVARIANSFRAIDIHVGAAPADLRIIARGVAALSGGRW